MKKGLWIVSVALALAGSFVLGRAQAQDEEKPNPMQDMDAWMELAKPGPEHAELKKMEGVWNCEVKSFGEPGAEPTVEKGKATFTMVLGDLFLRQDYEGSMMGQAFTGIGYTAFNKAIGKYESLWMDSGGSGMSCTTGEEKDNVCTYRGHFFGPGGVKITTRYLLTKVNDDKQTLVMYMGAGEMKSMEMTYTRAK